MRCVPLALLALLAGSCLGVSSQDLTAIQTAALLDKSAYCHLATIEDAGDAVRSARSDMRAAATADRGVLRRNHVAVDAPDGGGFTCP